MTQPDLVLLPRVAFRGREITGARLHGLPALLAGELRTGCSTASLVDGLWADDRPEHPTKALQVLVSRARTQLGPGVIASTATGYRLALAVEQRSSWRQRSARRLHGGFAAPSRDDRNSAVGRPDPSGTTHVCQRL